MTPNQRIASDMRERAASLADEYIGVSGELTATEYATRLANHIRSLALPADPASGEGADAQYWMNKSEAAVSANDHVKVVKGMQDEINHFRAAVSARVDDLAARDAEIATLRNDLTQRAKLIAARDAEIATLRAALVDSKKAVRNAAYTLREKATAAIRKRLIPLPQNAYDLGRSAGLNIAIEAIEELPIPADPASGEGEENCKRCNICGFVIDTHYKAEKPTIDFTMAGRVKKTLVASGEGVDYNAQAKSFLESMPVVVAFRGGGKIYRTPETSELARFLRGILAARDAEIATLRRLEADARASAAEWRTLSAQNATQIATLRALVSLKQMTADTSEPSEGDVSREDLEYEYDRAQEEIVALREALTPSCATKSAYIGEFKFCYESVDEDGEAVTVWQSVPWNTIKDIMKAILTRAESSLSTPAHEASRAGLARTVIHPINASEPENVERAARVFAALVEARIEGLREAAAIIRGNVILYQGGETKLRPRPDGEVSNLAYADAIDARIASLKTDAKPLDTDNSPP